MYDFPKYEITNGQFEAFGYAETMAEASDVTYRQFLEDFDNGIVDDYYIFELDVNTGERIREVGGDEFNDEFTDAA